MIKYAHICSTFSDDKIGKITTWRLNKMIRMLHFVYCFYTNNLFSLFIVCKTTYAVVAICISITQPILFRTIGIVQPCNAIPSVHRPANSAPHDVEGCVEKQSNRIISYTISLSVCAGERARVRAYACFCRRIAAEHNNVYNLSIVRDIYIVHHIYVKHIS